MDLLVTTYSKSPCYLLNCGSDHHSEQSRGIVVVKDMDSKLDQSISAKDEMDSTRRDSTSNELGDIDHPHGAVQRGLKSRHAQMIALGGCVGTGLFVGTGATLALGGPAFLLVGFILMSFFTYVMVTLIVEMATYLPIAGTSMPYYATRYVSKSLGFAMGWLYVYSLGILVPYEITAGALVIDYWNSPVNIGVWITIFFIVIVGLNLFPVKYYGESEFWFSCIKTITILGLLIMSFVLFWGGGTKQHGILGFHYWKDPGATGTWLVGGSGGTFCAFLGALVYSAFPFTFAPELLTYSTGEIQNPRKSIPKAGNRFIFRLVVFYVGSVFAMGVICPYTDPDLISGGTGAKSSPWVVGIRHAGISGLDSVVNGAILTTAWSAGNTYLYMSSRALYSLATVGQAPKIFAKCSDKGVPYPAVLACSLFALLSYLNVGSSSSVVFRWLVNITTTSGFISWICCCIVYLRFRSAWKFHGRPHLPYHSWLQPWGAWAAAIFFAFLCLVNAFNVFFPGQFSASSFLTAYIGIPVFVVFYVGHKVVHGRSDPFYLRTQDIDIMEGIDQIVEDDSVDGDEEKPSWRKWTSKFKKTG